MPDACQRCRQPVLVRPTTLGHNAVFDPEPVIGGEWHERDGVMRRIGAGPRRAHRLHDRSCTEVVLTSLIPIDRDYRVCDQPSWRSIRIDSDNE